MKKIIFTLMLALPLVTGGLLVPTEDGYARDRGERREARRAYAAGAARGNRRSERRERKEDRRDERRERRERHERRETRRDVARGAVAIGAAAVLIDAARD